MANRQPKHSTKNVEQFTKLIHGMMQSDAWRWRSPTAQALYPWLF